MAHLASITLLVGAHKTASTHLQTTLLSVRERLAPEGVGVVGPREVRDFLRPAIQPETRSPIETVALAHAALSQLCPGARHVVVMEENTLGVTARNLLLGEGGLIYPFATRRLREALACFGGAEVRVGLAIRNPATFLASCWSEHLLNAPWQPFRDYVAGIPPDLPRWLWLTNRMLQATDDLTIWTYEDYPAVLPQIIDWATGLKGFGATVTPYELAPRPGLSQRAAEILHTRMTEDPERDHKVALRRARRVAPLGPNTPRFDPWSIEEHALFAESYAEDLLSLATASPVRWLTPALR
ncbi:hypothetical protein [Rhodobacter maris]|uniref:Sulfotransferase family protein n=1 Tax=Rhodobacter maris TaxID=446682 RepID=A0A285RIY0_9RHOB|nr:hypothetical protein [Rhodobacter maris]SOB94041.1 hypothetical protein SAMN05877831_101313 [Rhodobacter maris]